MLGVQQQKKSIPELFSSVSFDYVLTENKKPETKHYKRHASKSPSMLPGMSLICCASIKDTWPLSPRRNSGSKTQEIQQKKGSNKKKKKKRKQSEKIDMVRKEVKADG